MPKIKRRNLPLALLARLVDRRQKWSIAYDQIAALADWLETNPEVPNGKWFKDFSSFGVCGQGELIMTFLPRGRLPEGVKVL
jgi:hypothetical protein